jgi:hypothetical protein
MWSLPVAWQMVDDYAVCSRAGGSAYLDAARYYNTAAWRQGLLLDTVTQAEQFLAWRLGRAGVELHRLPPVAFVGCDCALRVRSAPVTGRAQPAASIESCAVRKTNMWSHVCTYSVDLGAATFSEYEGAGARVVAASWAIVRERGWQPNMIGRPVRVSYTPAIPSRPRSDVTI